MAGSPGETPKPKPRRKKILRACSHCHKGHITCDEGRPCQPCLRRGLADTCKDAPRKSRKYLADVPAELIAGDLFEPVSSSGVPLPQNNTHSDGRPSQLYQTMGRAESLRREHLGENQLAQDPQSVAVQHSLSLPTYLLLRQNSLFPDRNLDYGMYSPNQDPSQAGVPTNTRQGSPGMPPAVQHQLETLQQSRSGLGNDPVMTLSLAKQGQQMQPGSFQDTGDFLKPANFQSTAADLEYSTLSSILQDNFGAISSEGTPGSNVSPSSPFGLQVSERLPKNGGGLSHETKGAGHHDTTMANFPALDARINQYFLGHSRLNQGTHDVGYPEVSEAINHIKQHNLPLYRLLNLKLVPSFTIAAEPRDSLSLAEPELLYATITRPYSYTPGYHKLIAYLRGRFPRAKLVKMAKSMAEYRPSFIACTNLLREADLIFMEQCFQRTLLTYDYFIKVSGTPTIVWRRTGEIAYVGTEFTLLTGWTRQQLLGPKPMFIVELLDDESVVEYFELFSRIAFGDFLGATMTECTLITPKDGVRIRAGCMWTLKRDVFGIPMMIIGNFLPIV